MNRGRGNKRIAKTTKGAKVSVCGVFVVEEECRGGVVFGFGWEYVEDVGGHL